MVHHVISNIKASQTNRVSQKAADTRLKAPCSCILSVNLWGEFRSASAFCVLAARISTSNLTSYARLSHCSSGFTARWSSSARLCLYDDLYSHCTGRAICLYCMFLSRGQKCVMKAFASAVFSHTWCFTFTEAHFSTRETEFILNLYLLLPQRSKFMTLLRLMIQTVRSVIKNKTNKHQGRW